MIVGVVGVVVVVRAPGRIVHRLQVAALRVRRVGGARVLELRAANHGNVDEWVGARRLVVELRSGGRLRARLHPGARPFLARSSGVLLARVPPFVHGRVRAVVSLARFAGETRLPTVISAIGLETWGAVIPELTDAYPTAPHIVRASVNPWDDTRVRTSIERSRREKLVIAGGAGAPSVTLCALSAARAGYEVYCALDASAQLGHDAIARLAREGVIATTTSLITTEILSERSTRRRAWR